MFCGFNEKMLKGLTEFTEGLVEHGLMFKSEKNNESIEQSIRREISDMTRLLTETHRIEDSSKRLMTEGLVQYVMYFFMHIQQKEIKDYKTIVGKVASFFKEMDEKYYADLEGKPDDMKNIVLYLNKINI